MHHFVNPTLQKRGKSSDYLITNPETGHFFLAKKIKRLYHR